MNCIKKDYINNKTSKTKMNNKTRRRKLIKRTGTILMNSKTRLNHILSQNWRISKVCVVQLLLLFNKSEAEFKEFDRRLKLKPQLKYGWFHLKLYSMFQYLSRRLI